MSSQFKIINGACHLVDSVTGLPVVRADQRPNKTNRGVDLGTEIGRESEYIIGEYVYTVNTALDTNIWISTAAGTTEPVETAPVYPENPTAAQEVTDGTVVFQFVIAVPALPTGGRYISEYLDTNGNHHRTNGPAYTERRDDDTLVSEVHYLNGQIHKFGQPALTEYDAGEVPIKTEIWFHGTRIEPEFAYKAWLIFTKFGWDIFGFVNPANPVRFIETEAQFYDYFEKGLIAPDPGA